MIGAKLGRIKTDRGKLIEIGASLEVAPSVVFDALLLPDGEAAAASMVNDGRVLEFIKDTFRHCKPILALGASSQVLEAAGVPVTLRSGKPDPGLLIGDTGMADAFVTAIAKHRHYERETDPPAV
jgi:catalase